MQSLVFLTYFFLKIYRRKTFGGVGSTPPPPLGTGRVKELGLDNCSTPAENSTHTSCQMSSEDIVSTHDTFMKSLDIELSDGDKRLPYLYWTPKLHKSPVKHRFIAVSSKCTTKQLSSFLTKILTVIKTGLEKYFSATLEIILCGYLRIPQTYCHH